MSGTPCPSSPSLAFFPERKQAAPWRARYFLANRTGKFSEENLREKIPRRVFFPAFQGSGIRLHCLSATAPPPFQSGLGLFCKRHSKKTWTFARCAVLVTLKLAVLSVELTRNPCELPPCSYPNTFICKTVRNIGLPLKKSIIFGIFFCVFIKYLFMPLILIGNNYF